MSDQVFHARKIGPITRKNSEGAQSFTYAQSETEVIESVSGDKRRAKQALEAENATGHPRATLVAQLERVIGGGSTESTGTASPPPANGGSTGTSTAASTTPPAGA